MNNRNTSLYSQLGDYVQDNSNYYDITSSYGRRPNQKISSFITENFSHDDRNLLQDLGIVLFKQDSCSACNSVIRTLDLQNKIQILDLKNPQNMKQFVALKGQAVPFFFSQKTGKTFTGHPKTINNLINILGTRENFGGGNPSLKDLDVRILLSQSCGYCKKLKGMLEQNNLTNSVKIYYNDDSEVSSVFGKFKIDGVPFMYSTKTGKKITGCPNSIENMIQSLQ